MKDETSGRRRTLLWALPASLILHVLIAAFLVYGLPSPPEQPQEEQPVNVALVPPPEPPKPVPPPPPEQPEPKPPEQKAEKPASETPRTPDILKPVFQFGDKDTGPRKSLDGGSAQETSPSPAKDDVPKPLAEPKEAESKPAAAPEASERADPTKADEKPIAAPEDSEPTQEKQPTQDAGNPETDKPETQDADKQAVETAMPLAAPGGDEIELPISAQAPKPRPNNEPKPRAAKASKPASGSAGEPKAAATSLAYSGLPGVRRLFSQGATGDAFATDSMGDMPRDQRVAKLCASVLNQKLKDASYFAQLLPSIPLKAGNVLVAADKRFRTATSWYRVGYRCGIDDNATRVTSFVFRVGAATSAAESADLDREARSQGFQVGMAR